MTPTAGQIIERLIEPTGISHSALEKIVGVLVPADQFMNRQRRELWASDQASLFHAVMVNQPARTIEYDDALRELVFKGSWPQGRSPVFPTQTWGETLELMIQHAPPFQEHADEPATEDVAAGTLPHLIEIITNVPYVSLIWLGRDGRPTQRDGYGRKKAAPASGIIARKAVVDGKIISILGDILRIAKAAQADEGETAARLPGQAAA